MRTVSKFNEIDILLGVTYLGLENKQEALVYFEKAVRLAAPEGIIRPFIDINTFDLVSELRQNLIHGSESLLISFLDQITAYVKTKSEQDGNISPSEPAATQANLVEQLSRREMEVLQFMAMGLSNAEIARRLFLTINTLKAHTNSIYGKLDVHSRMQAVIRARQLGLLPPPGN